MMKATVTALCMTLVMVVYSEIFPNGTKLVYKEDLPDAFTFDKKKLDELKQKLMSQTKVSMKIIWEQLRNQQHYISIFLMTMHCHASILIITCTCNHDVNN